MTPAAFATHVRYKTRTNSTTFTDTEILALMAARQDEIAEIILKADEDILLIPQYLNLVADQREYPLPIDIISRIKRVEAKLNGTDWVELTEMDLTKIHTPISTETDITNQFANLKGHASFDISRKALYLLTGTITTVASGLRVYVDTYPTPVTDLTSGSDMSIDPTDTTHGIPRPLHRLWALGVIIDYKSSREKPIPLNERERNYEFDLQRAVETLKHGNLDREVIADIPVTVEGHGDDGSNY